MPILFLGFDRAEFVACCHCGQQNYCDGLLTFAPPLIMVPFPDNIDLSMHPNTYGRIKILKYMHTTVAIRMLKTILRLRLVSIIAFMRSMQWMATYLFQDHLALYQNAANTKQDYQQNKRVI